MMADWWDVNARKIAAERSPATVAAVVKRLRREIGWHFVAMVVCIVAAIWTPGHVGFALAAALLSILIGLWLALLNMAERAAWFQAHR